MGAEFNLAVNGLNTKLQIAFNQAAYELANEFTRVITEPRYWEAFDDVRDIVDTGRLRASQRVDFPGDLKATYTWPVEYALNVHEGVTTLSGRVIPGRPWTRIALEQFDAQQRFKELFDG